VTSAFPRGPGIAAERKTRLAHFPVFFHIASGQALNGSFCFAFGKEATLPPPRWAIKEGTTVEIVIDGIGTLKNVFG
jgi:hypothetical protein